MKKVKRFIVSSTLAVFLSSSAFLANASENIPEQNKHSSVTISAQKNAKQKLNRYQKKMYYKQKFLKKKEKQIEL